MEASVDADAKSGVGGIWKGQEDGLSLDSWRFWQTFQGLRKINQALSQAGLYLGGELLTWTFE